MSDLYTVKQVQDLLKVDRITVYRMLQDGRLKGIKIGHQWRFNASELEHLLGMETSADNGQSESSINLPIHCIQTIQNLFSDISQLSSLVVDMEGNPLTNISNPCAFCTRIMSSPSGRDACQASWRDIAAQCQTKTKYHDLPRGIELCSRPDL